MPLFFKKKTASEDHGIDFKARLEKKLCLAKEDPEPVFDLSECNLKAVHSGIYVLCKVLRKTTLILKTNQLTSLSGGGSFSDLALIEVLDISSNKLKVIPGELSFLRNLKVLNASRNQIEIIPESLAQLVNLQDLNLSENCLSNVPDFVANLPSLQRFDISSNPTKKLPTFKDPNLVIAAGHSSIVVEQKIEPTKLTTMVESSPSFKTHLEHNDESDQMQKMLQLRHQKQQELLKKLSSFDKEQQATLDKVLERQKEQQETFRFVAQIEAEEQQKISNVLAQEEARSCRLTRDILHGAQLEKSALEKVLVQEEARTRTLARALAEQEEAERAKLTQLLTSVSAINAPLLALVLEDQALQKSILAALRDRADSREQSLSRCVVDEFRLQQAALMALKEKGDTTAREIAQQMAQIQMELGHLSLLEVKKKKEQSDETLGEIGHQRTLLSLALSDLIVKQQKRRNELIDELSHQYDGMDEKLWMLQLNKLLLSVPESFQVQLRDTRGENKSPPATPSAPKLDSPGDAQFSPFGSPSRAKSPSAPTLEECVVCMDAQCEEVLLPCGHVCACSSCTSMLSKCPLCRADITQRLTLCWS